MISRGKIWSKISFTIILFALLANGGLAQTQNPSVPKSETKQTGPIDSSTDRSNSAKTITSRVIRTPSQFYGLHEKDHENEVEVRIEGTALYSDAPWNLMFFGSNEGKNLYLPIPSDSRPPPYRHKAILTGKVNWLNGRPGISNIQFKDLGKGELPSTRPLTPVGLKTEKQLNDWVFAAGTVVEVEPYDDQHARLVIAYLKKFLVQAVVANCRVADLQNLVGAHVELNGCCGPLPNPTDKSLAANQIFVPHFEQITVFRSAPKTVFDGAEIILKNANDEFDAWRDPRLIKIRGKLAQKVDERQFVLRGHNTTLSVRLSPQNKLPEKIKAGQTEIVAAGFLWKVDGKVLLDRAHVLVDQNPKPVANDDYPLLTTTRGVRGLSPKLAAEKIPVELTGTVTYYDPIWRVLFIQDSFGGIYVDKKDRRLKIRIGDLVRIKGVTDPGGYAPMILASDVKKLATGAIPNPRSVELGRLLSGAEDGQWSSIEGTVLSVTRSQANLKMKLANEDTEFEAVVCGAGKLLKQKKWVGSRIRLDGVCGIKANAKRQAVGIYFHVPSEKQIEFREEAIAAPFSLEPTMVADLFEFNSNDLSNFSGKMVRVEGKVTYSDNQGRVVIQDPSGGLMIQLESVEIPAPNEKINVVGFPTMKDLAPTLRKPSWQTSTFAWNLPTPPRIDFVDDKEWNAHHGQQVRLHAKVLANNANSPVPRLTLSSNSQIFHVELNAPFTDKDVGTAVPGSTVEITGVLDLDSRYSPSGRFIRLLHAQHHPIVTITPAPWWNTNHTVLTLASLACIVLLAIAWNYSLRRKVTQQTHEIATGAATQIELAARYKNLVDHANDLIFSLNDSGQFITLNPATERLFDTPNNRLAGRNLHSFLNEDSKATLDKALQDISDQHPHASIALTTSTGTVLEIAMQIKFDEDQTQSVHCIARDVSERERLEEQIRHMQKLESIGQLAAGVAHDYNNLLTVILGNSDLLLKNGNLDDSHFDNVEQINEAASRAAGLTQQLLAFSRRQVMRTASFRPEELLGAVGRMLQIVLRDNIELVIQIEDDLPPINADQTMLEQALLNLAMNSRDAMPAGGRIILSASRFKVDDNSADIHPEMLIGDYIEFTVSDNGEGIDPQTLPNIFEPFYTTKEVGKGTGLGLSTVYGIVKQHHGWVDAQSEENVGTRIRFFLPNKHAVETKSVPVKDPLQNWSGNNETILLVEDEWAVRLTVKKLLVEVGYRVIEASDGLSAIDIWKKSGKDIDLVVTDMVMPGMSGLEMAELMKGSAPELKIIYCSGYSSELAKERSLDPGEILLSKPFDTKTLLRTIREKLDSKISLRAG